MSMSDENLSLSIAKAIRRDVERQHEDRHDGPYSRGEDGDDGVVVDGVVNFIELGRAAVSAMEDAIKSSKAQAWGAGWSDGYDSGSTYGAEGNSINPHSGEDEMNA